MKIVALLSLIVVAPCLLRNDVTPLKSGVYLPSGRTIHGRLNILDGSTTHLEGFQLDAVTINAGDTTSSHYKLDDMEELIIVKDGSLKITINDSSKSIGPGSVAFLLAGKEHIYENSAKKPVTYYLLRFKSRAVAENQRGLTNGGSFIINWDDVTLKATDKGSLRSFFNRPTAMCSKVELHFTSLNEGLASHAPHAHPEEEIIIITKGKARINIEDAFHDAPAGTVVFYASGVRHALQNAGKGPVEYFALQWK